MTMRAVRYIFPLREVTVSPLQRVVFFSSFSAANPESVNSSSSDVNKGKSLPKFHRKIKWNSANFVGTVAQPLKVQNGIYDTPSAWTILRVKVSPESNSTFRILLNLSGKIAESSLQRLKPNDFINVAGTFESYKKDNYSGKSKLLYKLTVKELNYISQHVQGSSSQSTEIPQHEDGETRREKYRDRLQLWQVFLRTPDEWWDNRKNKLNPNQPDFVHKGTREALWLSSNDPPWIKKQLELLDSRMVGRKQDENFSSDSSMSKFLDWE